MNTMTHPRPENLLIAIPCRNEIRAVVFSDLIASILQAAVYWSTRHPGGAFHVQTFNRAHIVEVRNLAFEVAKQNGMDWVLWLDDDMAPPPDLLERLHETGRDFVGAVAYRRSHPHEPCVARFVDGTPEFYDPDPSQDLVKADLTGFACILTHVSVLDAVAEATGGTPFQMRPGLAEDHFFCQRARSVGRQLYVVPRVVVGHAADVIVGREHRLSALATVSSPTDVAHR